VVKGGELDPPRPPFPVYAGFGLFELLIIAPAAREIDKAFYNKPETGGRARQTARFPRVF